MTAYARYSIFRGALRAGIRLVGRPVRLLGAQRPPNCAAVLFICHPFRLLDALVLTGVSERPVHCLIDGPYSRRWRGLLARGLGIIPGVQQTRNWHLALRACLEVFRAGGILAVFAELDPRGLPQTSSGATLALAREAWASTFPEEAIVILPVHFFRPAARAGEILIHVGDAARWQGDEGRSGIAPQEGLVAALGEACRENVFALDPETFEQLLDDLEQVLRTRLAEQWAARPGRRQSVEGFRLSPLAAEALRRTNRLEPETLVTLRRLFDNYGEWRRKCSLVRLRAELGRKQLPPLQRLLGWMESIAGLPVAAYGLLNHLAAAFLLSVFGLLKRDQHHRAGLWLVRGVIVLGCYAAQIALVDHKAGRAAAGYYALTLPLSALYLWRYGRVLWRKTRVLALGARGALFRRLAESRRRQFFDKLDATLASMVKAPPLTSTR